jgi:dUTP pyrophosphatase
MQFLQIKKLVDTATIPAYATPGAAGFDLVACEDTRIPSGATCVIKTGLAFAVPRGYEMQIRPRSGISVKTKLRVILGTVDSDYRGEVGVIVENTGGEAAVVARGIRIAQAVISPVVNADMMPFHLGGELPQSERGVCGFGSTGVMTPQTG